MKIIFKKLYAQQILNSIAFHTMDVPLGQSSLGNFQW